MRAYSAPNEEALRARHLLKDWAGEGFLSDAQYQRMEQETVCDFRRTNIFLRIVLFLFTLLVVAAAVALFFAFFVPDSARRNPGFLLFFLAAVFYGGAEAFVAQARLYRYGIEEALAVCSIGFLCAGMQFAFSGGLNSGQSDRQSESFILVAGAIASLWIWRRFGLSYAFLAAMIFVIFLPGFWTSSAPAQHLILAAIYAAGLVAVVAIRDRYRLTYLNHEYSIVEALLWLGVYLSINLHISPVDLLGIWRGDARNADRIARPFYWLTWVLIWCLPPIVLTRGIRRKDRLVIAVGAILAVVTLATNKPYLGWQRHTWDPMLLGALLIGVALFIRRWLAQGPDGVRHGFTAQRLSGKDKNLLNAGTIVFGAVAPHSIPVSQQSESLQFGGGDSGGGGASSEF
jgi:hypothetical protein